MLQQSSIDLGEAIWPFGRVVIYVCIEGFDIHHAQELKCYSKHDVLKEYMARTPCFGAPKSRRFFGMFIVFVFFPEPFDPSVNPKIASPVCQASDWAAVSSFFVIATAGGLKFGDLLGWF